MYVFPLIIVLTFFVTISASSCMRVITTAETITETTAAETTTVQTVEETVEEISNEEKLEDTLFAFFDAVLLSEEYKYFSSATKDIVGTEEEYKNGDKTDIYFIIQESHSSWENIEIQDISIDGKAATVTFTGDREAEGMKYEGEEISFNFVKEGEEWMIDFSS